MKKVLDTLILRIPVTPFDAAASMADGKPRPAVPDSAVTLRTALSQLAR
ncbi:MAG: hypothetical protein MUC79_06625 [Thiobacillaceae bacterium]|nr:hypothetical protein [Thiobacillaceae bacterium]